ncbi:MAG: hypothetical protein EOM50_10235 [Erysipelotrichia bacterium]|nr:hypothetical protein [Erysipelotrichia bacterium]NCC55072.1 hypothetical protein [Erysipelotrichia bacterium]
MINAYIDVLTLIKADGEKVPKVIIWSNNHEYKIDSCMYTGNKLSLGGKCGLQYICNIANQQRKLYFDTQTGKWFIDIAER